jgi:hypothetical protein
MSKRAGGGQEVPVCCSIATCAVWQPLGHVGTTARDPAVRIAGWRFLAQHAYQSPDGRQLRHPRLGPDSLNASVVLQFFFPRRSGRTAAARSCARGVHAFPTAMTGFVSYGDRGDDVRGLEPVPLLAQILVTHWSSTASRSQNPGDRPADHHHRKARDNARDRRTLAAKRPYAKH